MSAAISSLGSFLMRSVSFFQLIEEGVVYLLEFYGLDHP